MKKILMFVITFGLLLGAVSAADLQEHDFDGHFKLDVPGNAFYVDASADGYKYTSNDGQGLTIQYITTDDINGASFADYIDSLGLKDGKTDGNFTVFQKDGKYVVIANSTDEMYIITDKNLDEAKAIAESVDLGTDQKDSSSEKSNANSSVDLKSQDFQGLFTMDVPKDSDFGGAENYDEKLAADSVTFEDAINNVSIHYIDDKDFNDEVVKDTVDNLEKEGATVSTNDDLYVITANGATEIILHDGAKTIMIASNQLDQDTLTAMAQSVEFTK